MISHAPASSKLDEIFQDMQADIAGFFGVELRRENIFKLKSRSDFLAVVGRRRDNFFVVGEGVIAVHEVEIRIIFYSFEQIPHCAFRITH